MFLLAIFLSNLIFNQFLYLWTNHSLFNYVCIISDFFYSLTFFYIENIVPNLRSVFINSLIAFISMKYTVDNLLITMLILCWKTYNYTIKVCNVCVISVYSFTVFWIFRSTKRLYNTPNINKIVMAAINSILCSLLNSKRVLSFSV